MVDEVPVPEAYTKYLEGGRRRANFLTHLQQHQLLHAADYLERAFGCKPYLVGSCLYKSDFRDVDLRVLLSEEDHSVMFPDYNSAHDLSWRKELMHAALSMYLSSITNGLNIDFQFQRKSEWERYKGHPRTALFVIKPDPDKKVDE